MKFLFELADDLVYQRMLELTAFADQIDGIVDIVFWFLVEDHNGIAKRRLLPDGNTVPRAPDQHHKAPYDGSVQRH